MNYINTHNENANQEFKESQKKITYENPNANNIFNESQNNPPQDQVLNEGQPAQAYNQYPSQEQFYYNNQYVQQSNVENNAQHIQNYREEERNESENEEGDGYFKRLQWEN